MMFILRSSKFHKVSHYGFSYRMGDLAKKYVRKQNLLRHSSSSLSFLGFDPKFAQTHNMETVLVQNEKNKVQGRQNI